MSVIDWFGKGLPFSKADVSQPADLEFCKSSATNQSFEGGDRYARFVRGALQCPKSLVYTCGYNMRCGHGFVWVITITQRLITTIGFFLQPSAKIRTQRILGRLISDGQESGELASSTSFRGNQHEVASSQAVTRTLGEIGITHKQSSAFKAIASIPEETFEEFIAEEVGKAEAGGGFMTPSSVAGNQSTPAPFHSLPWPLRRCREGKTSHCCGQCTACNSWRVGDA